MASAAGRALPVVTDAERAVADLLPIEVDPAAARRALARVPLWFHTFALNREHSLYTPGVARDHRYRVPFLPLSFAGERVLDVGTFDGFYAFLAEHRRAAYVVAAATTSSTSAWVRRAGGSSWAEARASRRSPNSWARACSTAAVTRLSSTAPQSPSTSCSASGSCTGSRTRWGCCGAWPRCLAPAARLLVETYGIASDGRLDARTIEVHHPGGVYAGDQYVYWGFAAGGLSASRRLAGLTAARIDATVVVDGHPRIIATLTRAS